MDRRNPLKKPEIKNKYIEHISDIQIVITLICARDRILLLRLDEDRKDVLSPAHYAILLYFGLFHPAGLEVWNLDGKHFVSAGK